MRRDFHDDADERDNAGGADLDSPQRTRRALVIACNVLVALVLLAPFAVGALVRDLTIFAGSAIVAVILVRFLLLGVIPWLEGPQADDRAD